jgi:hypothetical protein
MKLTYFTSLFTTAVDPTQPAPGTSGGGELPPGTMPAGAAFAAVQMETPASQPQPQSTTMKHEAPFQQPPVQQQPMPHMQYAQTAPMNSMRASVMTWGQGLFDQTKKTLVRLLKLAIIGFAAYAVYAFFVAPPVRQTFEIQVHKPLTNAGIFSRWGFNSDENKRTIIERNAATGATRLELIDSKGRHYIPGEKGWKRVED